MDSKEQMEGLFCPRIICKGRLIRKEDIFICPCCGIRVIDFSEWIKIVENSRRLIIEQAWRKLISRDYKLYHE